MAEGANGNRKGSFKDITGQTRGGVVAEKLAGSRSMQALWACRCVHCGSVKNYRIGQLRQGIAPKSCGCKITEDRSKAQRTLDIAGNSFGRLTAQTWAGAGKWHCTCTCGGSKDIPGKDLVRGRVASCGCIRLEKALNPQLAWLERVAELDAFDAILGPSA